MSSPVSERINLSRLRSKREAAFLASINPHKAHPREADGGAHSQPVTLTQDDAADQRPFSDAPSLSGRDEVCAGGSVVGAGGLPAEAESRLSIVVKSPSPVVGGTPLSSIGASWNGGHATSIGTVAGGSRIPSESSSPLRNRFDGKSPPSAGGAGGDVGFPRSDIFGENMAAASAAEGDPQSLTIENCFTDETPRIRLIFSCRKENLPCAVTTLLGAFSSNVGQPDSALAPQTDEVDWQWSSLETQLAELLQDGGSTIVGGGSSSQPGPNGTSSSLAEETSYAHIFMEAHAKRHHQQRSYRDAYWLDSGTISGEHRKRVIALQSYRSSVLPFVDKKVVKKYLNQEFFLRHPEELRITHIRSIKRTMLQFAVDEGSSLLELGTVACAVWYFERLIGKYFVTKANRKLVVSACLLLGVKFWESGITNNREMAKKIAYALGKCEECFSVPKDRVIAAEFRIFAALDFALMPCGDVVAAHVDRLLLLINVTRTEFYSKHYRSAVTEVD